MIAAALALALAVAQGETGAAGSPPGAAGQFERITEDAGIALFLAEERACAYPRYRREVRRLRARLGMLLERAKTAFGRDWISFNLIEPSRDGPACERFHESARASIRLLDEAEAVLAAAERSR